MNPVRVMAKLTEQTPNPGGVGGVPELDVATCAALCARLDRKYYLAARLKWCLDWTVASELEYLLWVHAAGLASHEGWRVPRGRQYLRRMAGLAIAETADPKHWSTQAARCEFIGMDAAAWSRRWRGRYEAIFGMLNDWSATAWYHIRKMQA